jgi:predicted O-methyltransferase YrrM
MRFRTVILAVEGVSIAVLRTLLSQGPRGARRVMVQTLDAAHKMSRGRKVHEVSFWDMARLFAVDEALTLNGAGWMDGCAAPLERFFIAQLLRYFKPKVLLEVGTYRGTTTRLLLDNVAPDATIYTIDLPLDSNFEQTQAATDARLIKHRQVGIDFAPHRLAKCVTQILGNTLNIDTWRAIPPCVEFAFIDASHSYDAVRNDTERVLEKIVPDGIVLWHDYTSGESPERGVGKLIRELMISRDDIFICEGTSMAFRIPVAVLERAKCGLPAWFPAGDYFQRQPDGPVPWLNEG